MLIFKIYFIFPLTFFSKSYTMPIMKIENDVPVPENVRGRKPKYDFKSMKIGDSFFAEGDGSTQVSILTCAKRHSPKRFITQKATQAQERGKAVKGFRCWRVE